MERDWNNLTYLLKGTARQNAAFHALEAIAIFSILREFDPILVGTIPLDIDIPTSDLDIICYAPEIEYFQQVVLTACDRFQPTITRKIIDELPTAIARFDYKHCYEHCTEHFTLEIFAQPRPVRQQRAFRHMAIEAQLLHDGGDTLRHTIRQLKLAGIKTEPAFARVFNLAGDPYQALLQL